MRVLSYLSILTILKVISALVKWARRLEERRGRKERGRKEERWEPLSERFLKAAVS